MLFLRFAFLTRKIDDGAVFNVIVLIGSLISTVVVVFTMILRTLEEYCRISTNEPNKHVVGDHLTSASIESTLAGTLGAGDAIAEGAAASSLGCVSSQKSNVDFNDDIDRDRNAIGATECHDAYAQNADGVRDDWSVMGSRPFHGNVVIQSSECAIEMQNVHHGQSPHPCISSITTPLAAISVAQNLNLGTGTAAQPHGKSGISPELMPQPSANESTAQLIGMMASIQREMRDLMTQQQATLSAQMMQFKSEMDRKIESMLDLKFELQMNPAAADESENARFS